MYFLNRHSKYERAKYGKMAIFVSRLNLHLDKRVRARWTRAWGMKTKSPAHLIFSWHGGRLRFSPLKSPCTKKDRQTQKESDRQRGRDREWANPRHHDAQVSASPAVMLHWLIYTERSSSAAQDSLLPWTLSAVSSYGCRCFCTAPAAFWRSYRQ